MSKLIPSATVITLRQSRQNNTDFEVLLLQRNSKLKTHGGSWVFPGGKFDTLDYAGLSESLVLTREQTITVAHAAAIRETREEAGIVLTSSDLKLHSNWLTPEGMRRRYDAWFFMAESDTDGVQVVIDNGEICDYRWMKPEDALQAQVHGNLVLPPPTFVTLLRLSAYENACKALTEQCRKPIYYRPKLVMDGGVFCSLYEEDAGYEQADRHAQGARHRLTANSDGGFSYLQDF